MRSFHRLLAGAALLSPFLAGSAQAAAPDVVVSIKPIASLVSLVMEGVGMPRVLVSGNASPHTYTLRPSDAVALEKADLVFRMGPKFETFLAKPLETLGTKAEIVTLADTPGIIALPLRTGGAFEAHDHSHDGEHAGHDHAGESAEEHAAHADHDHEDGTVDLHMWLDPQNAKRFVAAIRDRLAKADPQNAARYAANADGADKRLDALQAEIAQALAPVRNTPFVVFHDAYQYFDARFGLNTVGSITVSPETAPGARRLSEIRQRIVDLKAVCVFSEPQFEPRVVSVVMEGTPARTGVLDPEGAALDEGPELYVTLLTTMAQSLKTCLSDAS